jgi:hypothetical protein
MRAKLIKDRANFRQGPTTTAVALGTPKEAKVDVVAEVTTDADAKKSASMNGRVVATTQAVKHSTTAIVEALKEAIVQATILVATAVVAATSSASRRIGQAGRQTPRESKSTLDSKASEIFHLSDRLCSPQVLIANRLM